jgi:hypothetical protein
MEITLQVPDELGKELESHRDNLIEIIELGLQQVKTLETKEFLREKMRIEELIKNSSPDQIMTLQASPKLQIRISELVSLEKVDKLTTLEKEELDGYILLEHLVIMAKARAAKQLAGRKKND